MKNLCLSHVLTVFSCSCNKSHWFLVCIHEKSLFAIRLNVFFLCSCNKSQWFSTCVHDKSLLIIRLTVFSCSCIIILATLLLHAFVMSSWFFQSFYSSYALANNLGGGVELTLLSRSKNRFGSSTLFFVYICLSFLKLVPLIDVGVWYICLKVSINKYFPFHLVKWFGTTMRDLLSKHHLASGVGSRSSKIIALTMRVCLWQLSRFFTFSEAPSFIVGWKILLEVSCKCSKSQVLSTDSIVCCCHCQPCSPKSHLLDFYRFWYKILSH